MKKIAILTALLLTTSISLYAQTQAVKSTVVSPLYAPQTSDPRTAISETGLNQWLIQVAQPENQNKVEVNVYDKSENLIFSKVYEHFDDFSTKLSLNSLNTGDYMLEVSNGLFRTARQVFVR
jgi:hypothetical protein